MLSKILKQRRVELKIIPEEAADKFHVEIDTVSDWESGRDYPDLPTLLMISDYYALPFEELIRNEPQLLAELKKDICDRYRYNTKNVRHRFGICGLFLFHIFSKRACWHQKWGIFKVYATGSLFLLIPLWLLIGLSFGFVDVRSITFLLITLCIAFIYGLWAEDYLRNRRFDQNK
ncbi:MAG: helix-turn-helix transcriptional regulator [Lentilactobacillus diolivorans]|uniref:helix-turn-helix transcriptional regulator n=1 Tax=Lentilactobacillus diolivorans TaxID=179838 RepID=UPI0039EAFDF2